MLFGGGDTAAAAVLRAMRTVATVGGQGLTSADRDSLRSAECYVFGFGTAGDVDHLTPITPDELAVVVTGTDARSQAVGFLAVMATVDGAVDAAKIAEVSRFAAALDVDDAVVRELGEAQAGKLAELAADMTRQNMLSITGRPWQGPIEPWLQPYTAKPDPALAERYRSLADLAEPTFGRAFYDFYVTNGFAFAGEPGALNERFATPHDSTHVLSGYSTTPQGELLVSTFTAGMHPHEPVSGHILPVIFSWHLGIFVNQVAGTFHGALDPKKFWAAWSRGSSMSGDPFAGDWDFWAATTEQLDDLRHAYRVPALDPALEADDSPPSWYRPTP